MDRREEYTGRTDDQADVICAELDYIIERREALGWKADSIRAQQQELEKGLQAKKQREEGNQTAASSGGESSARTRPGVEAGLVGLALSGGGIRSATFNLGLLQALTNADVLRHVDYLSTVSGGGYIGSCLISLLHPDAQDEAPVVSVKASKSPFRIADDHKGDERPEIKHLRGHGTYLLPSGRLLSPDFWRMVGMYLSGVVVNNFVPLAMIIALSWALMRFRSQVGESLWSYAYIVAALIFLMAVLIRAVATCCNLTFQGRRIRGRLIGDLAALSAGIASVGGAIQLSANPELLGNVKTFLDSASGASVAGLTAGLADKGEELWRFVMEKVFKVARVALVPLVLLQGLIWLSGREWITMSVGEWIPMPVGPLNQVSVFLALSVVLVVASLYINPNRTSMHHFYRDRLSEAYVIRSTKGGKVKSNEDLALNDLYPRGGGSGAPYHIINTTLNVPSTRDWDLRGRGAALFIYSGLYCGSEATSYCRTDLYEKIGDTRLATAMAISGAALSPQMGSSTGPVMSFILTLLNLRLNRWVPNPNRLFIFKETYFKWTVKWRWVGRPWPWYFFKELFNRGTEEDILLNLSDGGHFENLGVYALLQRRCRYVIVSDAGMDPKFKLEDLSDLIRKARIDLGVDITIDLRGLDRDGDNKRSLLYHAVGEIRYPDEEETGVLILIKTTLTGKEPEDLVDYERKQPTFPDESTGDQFFREPQFESYRKLGELSGMEVVASVRKKLPKGFDGNGRFIKEAPDFFLAVRDQYNEQFPDMAGAASS